MRSVCGARAPGIGRCGTAARRQRCLATRRCRPMLIATPFLICTPVNAAAVKCEPVRVEDLRLTVYGQLLLRLDAECRLHCDRHAPYDAEKDLVAPSLT